MSNLGATELLIILIIVFVFAVVVIFPYFKIFGKAGFSPWLSLLMVLPLINIVVLYVFAFSDWPSLKEKKEAS